MILTLSTKTPEQAGFDEVTRARAHRILENRMPGVTLPYVPLGTHLSSGEGALIHHTGIFGYLIAAWSNHYSIVIRPDDIWFAVLSEIGAEIKRTPKVFEKMFTTSDKKELIVIPTLDPTTIDPSALVDALRSRMPTNVDDFLVEFSTTTVSSRFAMQVALCDAVDPYYLYGTMLCGFPAVDISGTKEDWHKLVGKLSKLAYAFEPTSSKVCGYCARVARMVDTKFRAAFDQDMTAEFETMLKLRRCGSGSDKEVNGWITELSIGKRTDWTDAGELPTQIAMINYKNLDTGRTFKMYCGLTESRFAEGGFLVPDYKAYRVETTPRK